MDTNQVIEIIKATSGSIDSFISQLAWFFAVKAAADWLSFTVPLLLLFSVLLRIASSLKVEGGSAEKRGGVIFFAWVFFGIAMFTGVKGMAPVLQAALSPSVYVMFEAGDMYEVIKQQVK
jgi:hypothetical protein